MKTRLVLAAMMLGAGMLAGLLPAWGQAKRAVSYSRAPGDVVIAFDQLNSKERRRTEEPYMQIYGDGRIVARNVYRVRSEKETRMTAEQLDALMRELLVDCRLVRFDAEKYRAKLLKEGFSAADYKDEPTTAVTITLQDRTIMASQIGLDLAATRYLTFDELQRLHTGGKRLKTLWSQVMTGEFVSEAPATTTTAPATTSAPATTQAETQPG